MWAPDLLTIGLVSFQLVMTWHLIERWYIVNTDSVVKTRTYNWSCGSDWESHKHPQIFVWISLGKLQYQKNFKETGLWECSLHWTGWDLDLLVLNLYALLLASLSLWGWSEVCDSWRLLLGNLNILWRLMLRGCICFMFQIIEKEKKKKEKVKIKQITKQEATGETEWGPFY